MIIETINGVVDTNHSTEGKSGSAFDFLKTAPEWVCVTATLSDTPAGENEI